MINIPKVKIICVVIVAAIFILISGQAFNLKTQNSTATSIKPVNQDFSVIYQEAVNYVIPANGFETRLIFGDSIKKLVESDVIDIEKLKKIYGEQLPIEISEAINGSQKPIVINDKTAGIYLNLFWALGLSNKTEFNKQSPLNGDDLFRFASTGGWNLGEKENGGYYFNQIEAIKLTQEQEALVLKVAQNTFRPCCDNSTFFQDCNHGSALLGALELAASKGYSEKELYQLALQLNSFWFPDAYIKTALYFKIFENKDWKQIDSKEIMSFKYSSASGWQKNIFQKLQQLKQTLPQENGASCGIQR